MKHYGVVETEISMSILLAEAHISAFKINMEN